MSSNLSLQSYMLSTKNLSTAGVQNAGSIQVSNYSATPVNAVNLNGESKPDEFTKSEKNENNNKKKILYFLGLIGAALIGAGICAYIMKKPGKKIQPPPAPKKPKKTSQKAKRKSQKTKNINGKGKKQGKAKINHKSKSDAHPNAQSKNIGNTKPPKPIKPYNIGRFQPIDNLVYRGAQPNELQFENLKELGIRHVIKFNTTQTLPLGKTEKEVVEGLGMAFHDFSFKDTEMPTERQIKEFFEILNDAKQNGEKVYIHCRYGKDRTGLFAAIYKIKNGQNVDEVIEEMKLTGHNFEKIAGFIQYLKSDTLKNLLSQIS